MTDCSERPQTRRELLRSTGRGAVLVAAAALAWMLGARRGRATCGNEGLCAHCRAFDQCALPKARAARDAKDRSDGR